MYLCEILSKLQMFKVTNFMTFSDGLLICVILLINHPRLKTLIYLFSSGHNHQLKCDCACFMYVDEILTKLQFYEMSN